MIGSLSGTLRAKHPPFIVLEVHGIGYEVEVPMTTFYDLPEVGQALDLYTHYTVRDDAALLYGFRREPDRVLFRLLIKVNGVGPKMALGILSSMDASQFAASVHGGDTANLMRLPGVGRKTAERLIIEMRDRLDLDASGQDPAASALNGGLKLDDPHQEAIDALVSLGYKAAEASKRVQAVGAGENAACEDIIRLALRSTGK